MAFAQNLHQLFRQASSLTPILQLQLSSVRYNTTLTCPKLFVNRLSRLTTDEKLKKAFSSFGQLVEAKVITENRKIEGAWICDICHVL